MSVHRRRVRAIAVRVMVFLLLGAVVNVAVAWGCVLALPYRSPGLGGVRFLKTDESPSLLWELLPDAPIRAEEFSLESSSRFGWTHVRAGAIVDFPQPAENSYASLDVYATYAGWPMRSVRGCVIWDGRRSEGWQQGTIVIPDWIGSSWGTLPVRPIWPGFAINTLFYAVILGLLFAAPGKVRRWRRIRRGLCAKCAYPVGSSDVCTECGARVAVRC